MSADLLAEFDSFYKSSSNAQTPSQPPAPPAPSPFPNAFATLQPSPAPTSQPPPPTTTVSDDDIWGDFQGLSVASKEASREPDPWDQFEKPSTQTVEQDPWSDVGFGVAAEPAADHARIGLNQPIIRSSTLELFSNNIADIAESSAKQQPSSLQSSWTPIESRSDNIRRGSSGGEVLFDAMDELYDEPDDDEFGDFEAASPGHAFSSSTLAPSLAAAPLRIAPVLTGSSVPPNLEQPVSPYPQAPKSPSFHERNPFSGLAVSTAPEAAVEENVKSASPTTAWPSFPSAKPSSSPYKDRPASFIGEDDDWGDFLDLPPEPPQLPPTKTEDDWGWDAFDSEPNPPLAPTPAPKVQSKPLSKPQPAVKASSDDMPPTNVPPPSVLLSVFTQLFNLPQSNLFQTAAGQPFSLKNRILSDPTAIEFLKSYILTATVGARIIAGRKLRWKRDSILAQSMRIGPAAAGGKGGMKLTGVDKSETMREDREAADVVRIWREQLGRLRSAVSTANASMPDSSTHLIIPDLSETLTVKEQQGGLKATKPCVLCGIKREERVNKVDVNVEDSFGEWWVEHWGHRACKTFWQEHEVNLRQR